MDLRKWGCKQSIDCEEVDDEVPELDALVVGAHDVPPESWGAAHLCVVQIQLVKVDACECRRVHASHEFQESYRRPEFSP